MDGPLNERKPAGGPASECAFAGGGMQTQDTEPACPLQLARDAVSTACEHLARYAREADTSTAEEAFHAMKAADLLSAAAEQLSLASQFSEGTV